MSANTARGTTSGALAGAGMGASLAAPTMGLSVLFGAAIGGAIGWATGSAADLEKQGEIDHAQYLKDEQQRLADRQYDLNIQTQDKKFQTDDAGQLTSLMDTMKDPGVSLEAKLAAIDGQIAAGLGTESMKVALAQRNLLKQTDIGQRTLDNQLTMARAGIASAQTNRDLGLSSMNANNAALGVDGAGANAQNQSAAYQANASIEQAARQAGYTINANGSSGFDSALDQALAGPNTYQDKFRADTQNAWSSLNLNTLELINADQSYRASARLSKDSAQLNLNEMQWKIDREQELKNNVGLGLLYGLGDAFGQAQTAYSAGQGLNKFGQDMKWWGQAK